MYYFKLYHDVFEDLKIRKFSIHEKFAWIALLTLASRSEERGFIFENDEDIADYCDFNIKNDWLYFRDKLVAKGLIDLVEGGLQITNWEKCQTYDNRKPSDQPEAVKERVSRHRANKKKAGVTPCNAPETPCNAMSRPDPDIDPDPNTDLNSEAEVKTQDKMAEKFSQGKPRHNLNTLSNNEEFKIYFWKRHFAWTKDPQNIPMVAGFIRNAKKDQDKAALVFDYYDDFLRIKAISVEIPDASIPVNHQATPEILEKLKANRERVKQELANG
jgi:hypothetical protein